MFYMWWAQLTKTLASLTHNSQLKYSFAKAKPANSLAEANAKQVTISWLCTLLEKRSNLVSSIQRLLIQKSYGSYI